MNSKRKKQISIDTIPEIFKEKATEFQEMGYRIEYVECDKLSMLKWKRPPITFLLYFYYFPLFIPALVFNWLLGYKYKILLEHVDGRIDVKCF